MKKSGGIIILNSGYYHLVFKSYPDISYPIYIKYILDNRISIEYLSVTPFCWYIGYYKWYFKDEFINLIKNITKDE